MFRAHEVAPSQEYCLLSHLGSWTKFGQRTWIRSFAVLPRIRSFTFQKARAGVILHQYIKKTWMHCIWCGHKASILPRPPPPSTRKRVYDVLQVDTTNAVWSGHSACFVLTWDVLDSVPAMMDESSPDVTLFIVDSQQHSIFGRHNCPAQNEHTWFRCQRARVPLMWSRTRDNLASLVTVTVLVCRLWNLSQKPIGNSDWHVQGVKTFVRAWQVSVALSCTVNPYPQTKHSEIFGRGGKCNRL